MRAYMSLLLVAWSQLRAAVDSNGPALQGYPSSASHWDFTAFTTDTHASVILNLNRRQLGNGAMNGERGPGAGAC